MGTCVHCEKEFKEQANFCWNCGNPVKDIENEEFSVDSDDLIKTVKKLYMKEMLEEFS